MNDRQPSLFELGPQEPAPCSCDTGEPCPTHPVAATAPTEPAPPVVAKPLPEPPPAAMAGAKPAGPELYGRDLFGEIVKRATQAPLADRFGVPPFTVLDGRSGEWADRKAAWMALGIKSEIGRADDILGFQSITEEKYGYKMENKGVSVFDPHLCELAYRWWCPEGGQVVDPFAGGSVRGLIAGYVGRRYWGCDLRAEQVAANVAQAGELRPPVPPVWVHGDSTVTLEHAPAADMVFSCPPYGDLERYSDDPADLSTMEWSAFIAAYRTIIARAVGRLKPDRFAAFVIGDFRDDAGHYRNFVSETIAAFEAAGARYYNDAILVSPVGTAALRATRQFNAGRKLVKGHQNLVVFVKGDWRKAAAACRGEGL